MASVGGSVGASPEDVEGLGIDSRVPSPSAPPWMALGCGSERCLETGISLHLGDAFDWWMNGEDF